MLDILNKLSFSRTHTAVYVTCTSLLQVSVKFCASSETVATLLQTSDTSLTNYTAGKSV